MPRHPAEFTDVNIPNVFFSDSTGRCCHTVKDVVAINALSLPTSGPGDGFFAP